MASLGACADSAPELVAEDFVAPSTAADVDEVYSQLGTCHDSFITRGLTPRAEISSQTLWSAPASAPAGLVSWKTPSGWNRLVLANELTFDGIAEHLSTPDAACAAVHRLLTPTPVEGSTREQFTHALFYLAPPSHPYETYPAAGVQAIRTASPLALSSYLAVVYATRTTSASGTVTFSDVTEQHLPMYVSCTEPFATETVTRVVADAELPQIDTATCSVGADGNRCVAERGVHAAGNTCTFVVDASKLELLDGKPGHAIFGGTLAARGTGPALRYELTVDRFSR